MQTRVHQLLWTVKGRYRPARTDARVHLCTNTNWQSVASLQWKPVHLLQLARGPATGVRLEVF
eukprot:NODE_29886_length_433_cov_1.277778.p3 GENE.NODE_29886_length_433_cov_1.277778~~NODE_29886_length_433_cov_1.277778.p3  ORF type:complete len:63 (+),score=0.84 NODE_29886_length_433_cov_1.277778:39-227(+)